MNSHETQMTEILEKIGAMIRSAREDRGLTHAQLAEASGVDRAELSRIESGKRNVTLATLVRIAHAMDCTTEVIFQPKRH